MWATNGDPLADVLKDSFTFLGRYFESKGWSSVKVFNTLPIASMGLVYLPTCTIQNQPNVGK